MAILIDLLGVVRDFESTVVKGEYDVLLGLKLSSLSLAIVIAL